MVSVTVLFVLLTALEWLFWLSPLTPLFQRWMRALGDWYEELLFRGFFVAALWPSLGWWALLAAPLLSMLWHLAVWVGLVRRQASPWSSPRLPH